MLTVILNYACARSPAAKMTVNDLGLVSNVCIVARPNANTTVCSQHYLGSIWIASSSDNLPGREASCYQTLNYLQPEASTGSGDH